MVYVDVSLRYVSKLRHQQRTPDVHQTGLEAVSEGGREGGRAVKPTGAGVAREITGPLLDHGYPSLGQPPSQLIF